MRTGNQQAPRIGAPHPDVFTRRESRVRSYYRHHPAVFDTGRGLMQGIDVGRGSTGPLLSRGLDILAEAALGSVRAAS